MFELVEADDRMTNSMCKWVEATSLGDYALFLGATCTKVVHVVAGRCGGVRRNHIYYFNHRAEVHWTNSPSFSNVFYKEENSAWGNFNGITSVGYHVDGDEPPVWLLPPDM